MIKAVVSILRKNDMIQYRQVQKLTGFFELSSELDICLTGLEILARVVVATNQATGRRL